MIKLIVNNQELSIVTQKVVSGTHDYLTVEADFKGSTWDGLRKWVHFSMGEFNYIMPMLDDAIAEDQHLDLTEGTWEVYVHGNLIEDDEVTERITTDIKYLYVDAPHDGHPFPPLTPDFEELLANQVAEAKQLAEQLRRDAEAGFYADGATFYPDVDEDGIISWTNDKGRENPESQNIRGPKGETGDSGVYIGETEPEDPEKTVWINPNGGAGKLIVKTESRGTHQGGTWDTYTLFFDDGTNLPIRVYNGADGSGAGDMLKSIYDATNKAQDIFAYADAIKDKTTKTGILKGDGSVISEAVAGEDYVSPSGLADVATTGDYNDLSNKPEIPTGLSEVATSGDYNDLINKPTIPSGLAPVATTGSYNDLTDTPTIPSGWTVDSALSDSSTNPVQNKVIKQAIDGIEKRPNPNALTINVNGTPTVYDGSTAKTISIDTSSSGGGGTELLVRQIAFVFSTAIPAGGWSYKQIDVTYAGYTPLAVAGFSMPGYMTAPSDIYLNGTMLNIDVINSGATDVGGNGWVNVLYKKN